MGLYSVVCEYRGGTYIAQVNAADIGSAVRAWAAHLGNGQDIPGAAMEIAREVVRDLDDGDEPTPMTRVRNVWCVSAVADGDLMIATLILTAD